jgi:hypothetical protein
MKSKGTVVPHPKKEEEVGKYTTYICIADRKQCA